MALITNPLVEVLDGTDGGDLMIAYGHNKVVLGRGGNDYILGTQRTEAVFAGDGDDTAIGWSGDDTMVGNQGRDLLFGNQDADLLIGGQGFDTLYGGLGADTLFGNEDVNHLIGGEGADIFAFQPTVRREHEERPVTVLVGYHEETLVSFTIETVDPPPHEEQVTTRTDAPGRPNETADRAAWENYIRRAQEQGFTLVQYAPTDTEQLFPTYYREDTRTVTIDPPPMTVEVPHTTVVQVPDFEVQFIPVDRTLLTFEGLGIIADFTPGMDHLRLTGADLPAGAETSIVARDVNGQLTLSYEGTDIAVLVNHTAAEYSLGWWG